MTKIYLIRHAESIANTKGIYQGQTFDTGLSLLGKKQAVALARALAFEDLDAIFASPLIRTLTTAQILAKPHEKEVIKEENILETNHGKWEGKKKETIQKVWPTVYKKWVKNPAKTVFPEGESFLATQKRVLKWWRRFVLKEGNFTVVSHDNILRIIIADVLGIDLNKIWRFHLLPTGINLVERNGDFTQLTLLNGSDHLFDLKTDLSAHAL